MIASQIKDQLSTQHRSDHAKRDRYYIDYRIDDDVLFRRLSVLQCST